MTSRITTGTGDQGQTRILAGDTVLKSHPVVECTGKLDGFRAQLALVRLRIIEERPDAAAEAEFIFWLLHACFVIGACVSDPENTHPEWHPTSLSEKHLAALNTELRRVEKAVVLPKAFIAGATNRLSAEIDLVVTAARDFERSLVRLVEIFPALREGVLLPFVNRLSDYLFLLARHFEDGNHLPVDYERMR